MSATVVIPARLQSSRLPRKMLADVGGKPLIERTHAAAVEAKAGPVLVLTDDDEIAEVVRGFGGEVWMTDPGLESGTARIASVIDRIETDVVVNLQGDAPLIDPEVVARAAVEAGRTDAPVTLAVYRLGSADDVHDANVVKVVRASGGRILYCSRSPVPFVRDAADTADWSRFATFWGHCGIYAYHRSFLAGFPTLPPSSLEEAERLEQLRWLDAGIALHGFEVPPQAPSVDTQAQLDEVRRLLRDNFEA